MDWNVRQIEHSPERHLNNLSRYRGLDLKSLRKGSCYSVFKFSMSPAQPFSRGSNPMFYTLHSQHLFIFFTIFSLPLSGTAPESFSPCFVHSSVEKILNKSRILDLTPLQFLLMKLSTTFRCALTRPKKWTTAGHFRQECFRSQPVPCFTGWSFSSSAFSSREGRTKANQ